MNMNSRPTRMLIAFALLAVASGCASRESVIRKHLVSAGISEPMAHCMAEPLARNLTDQDLRRLADYARSVDRDPRDMTYGDVLRALQAIDDPHLVSVAVRSATGCALRP